jgi:hypothetical protein
LRDIALQWVRPLNGRRPVCESIYLVTVALNNLLLLDCRRVEGLGAGIAFTA